MTTKVQTPAAVRGKTEGGSAAGSVFPAIVLFAGWFIPGGGHFILGKWVRGLLLMISIAGMFAIGIALHGKIYTTGTGEPLDILGFAGDLGAGVLFLLARLLGWGQDPVLIAVADYGTKFIVVSGLLNIVAAVDAHSLATGEEALLTISHFSAVLLFSLCTSVVFGITQRAEPKMMLRFGALCFVMFVGGTIAASWLMWLVKH